MEAQRILTGIRRNPVKAGVIGLMLAYGACAYPWSAHGVYSGTVVDRETGEPIEGAVVVVFWTKCRIYEMDGCGVPHTLREAVTGRSGEFSISAVPGIDWNPLTYLKDWPYILVYALDHLPLSQRWVTVPGFEGDARDFERAMKRHPRVPLMRRNPLATGGRWERLERHADPDASAEELGSLGAHQLKRLVDEQQRRIWQMRRQARARGE